VPLGKSSPWYRRYGVYDPNVKNMVIKTRDQSSVRSTAVHELAHVIDYHLNSDRIVDEMKMNDGYGVGLPNDDVGMHDEYFGTLNKLTNMKAHAKGFLTSQDLDFQRRDDELMSKRDKRFETVDLDHSLSVVKDLYRRQETVFSDLLTENQFILDIPFQKRMQGGERQDLSSYITRNTPELNALDFSVERLIKGL
jgi:hypothetical protein